MVSKFIKIHITPKLIIVAEISERFLIVLDAIENISKVDRNLTPGVEVFSRRRSKWPTVKMLIVC